MPEWFDTHAHLDQVEFATDRAEVLQRARNAGVTRVLSIGVDAASDRATVGLAAALPGVYAAVGIHPNYCAQATEGDWQIVVQLARETGVVALGETGIDLYREHAPLELQRDYFDRHLRLSQETGLPFIVHQRASENEVLACLRTAAERGPLSGIMHAFSGSEELARECLALGLHLSFAGMVTFKNAQALRDVAAIVPIDRLLIETDSPYLSPHPLRGKRNEPGHVVHTATCLAEVRGVSLEALAARTTENALRLFRIPG